MDTGRLGYTTPTHHTWQVIRLCVYATDIFVSSADGTTLVRQRPSGARSSARTITNHARLDVMTLVHLFDCFHGNCQQKTARPRRTVTRFSWSSHRDIICSRPIQARILHIFNHTSYKYCAYHSTKSQCSEMHKITVIAYHSSSDNHLVNTVKQRLSSNTVEISPDAATRVTE